MGTTVRNFLLLTPERVIESENVRSGISGIILSMDCTGLLKVDSPSIRITVSPSFKPAR